MLVKSNSFNIYITYIKNDSLLHQVLLSKNRVKFGGEIYGNLILVRGSQLGGGLKAKEMGLLREISRENVQL